MSIPKNGTKLHNSWGIETKINVFTDSEDYLNSEIIRKYGAEMKTRLCSKWWENMATIGN
jgi:hypothetical protein